jgi:benzoyl-CoA reductase/2-hydroxyglutaryl-CoA dehydratase subunit BcrC/BadD/HgdB
MKRAWNTMTGQFELFVVEEIKGELSYCQDRLRVTEAEFADACKALLRMRKALREAIELLSHVPSDLAPHDIYHGWCNRRDAFIARAALGGK